VVGGGQIGYNWQWSNVVLGVEADIQASGQKGDAAFLCPGTVCNVGLTAIPAANAPVAGTFNQKLDWFGTLRGRAGITVTPTILAYVTGGLAYGHIETDGILTGFTAGGLATSSAFSSDKTKTGWTVGGGIEGRITGNWTGKVEYLYMDLGTVDTTGLLTTNFIPIRAQFSSKITDNIVRVGVNYKFN
jgi:outer membrane immunogenic protein